MRHRFYHVFYKMFGIRKYEATKQCAHSYKITEWLTLQRTFEVVLSNHLLRQGHLEPVTQDQTAFATSRQLWSISKDGESILMLSLGLPFALEKAKSPSRQTAQDVNEKDWSVWSYQ